MKQEQIQIRNRLKGVLSPSRFEHTLGVAYTAAALAMRYGEDLKKAELAGLLHDCAKYYSDDVIAGECEKRGLALTPEEILTPAVIHAKLGAWMAKEEYGIEDEAILSAIRFHTTGTPEMTLLQKIIYIADFIEPGREHIPNLETIRSLAFVDIDKTMTVILSQTVEYLTSQGTVIEENTLLAWNYYRDLTDETRRKETTL